MSITIKEVLEWTKWRDHGAPYPRLLEKSMRSANSLFADLAISQNEELETLRAQLKSASINEDGYKEHIADLEKRLARTEADLDLTITARDAFAAETCELEAQLAEKDAMLGKCVEALTRIAGCVNAPDIDATGDWQKGLYCGVEDRNCRDRYDGADFGHVVGVEKALEWSSNEAKYVLASLPTTTQDVIAKARNEAEDAKRYRWMRENWAYSDHTIFFSSFNLGPFATLDDAIDSALKTEEK
jgi:hypothetical protein